MPAICASRSSGGSNPGAGTGYYKKPETQFVDAAEEVTTEQPQTAQEVRATIPPKPKRSDSKYQFGPWQGKKGMDAYKRDLYRWTENYAGPGTIEIPEFPFVTTRILKFIFFISCSLKKN